MEDEKIPTFIVCDDESERTFIDKQLKAQVIAEGEGYSEDWVRVKNIMTPDGKPCTSGHRVYIEVYDAACDVWSTGSVIYSPNWCGTKYNFSPLGNIYAVFDHMRSEQGYTFLKNNPDFGKDPNVGEMK